MVDAAIEEEKMSETRAEMIARAHKKMEKENYK